MKTTSSFESMASTFAILLAHLLLHMVLGNDRHGTDFEERDIFDGAPSASPSVGSSSAPSASPTRDALETSEDPNEGGPVGSVGGNSVSTGGIVAIALGSGFLVVAAIAFRRLRNRSAAGAMGASTLDGTSTDPGDALPM